MPYENNHYVPQFILRSFGNQIDVFNVKEQTLMLNRQPGTVFSDRAIYPPDLEREIGHKLEQPFSVLFHAKLEKGNPGDKVVLNRKELFLMKRFFLLEMMRVKPEKDQVLLEKVVFANDFKNTFTEKEIPGETAESRWHRNLRTIIEVDDLRNISKHELCTYEVLRWANVLTSGYFAFWDCSQSETDFIINDIGMTTERDDSVFKYGYEREKIDYTKSLLARETRIDKRTAYEDILRALLGGFYENFYMFPLSKGRMIVLVNPFFRLYDKKEKLFKPTIWPTHVEDRRLFAKNVSPDVPVYMGKPLYRDDDEFVYTIMPVSDADAEYINMLMLDRVDTLLGYSSKERIIKSVRRYVEWHRERNIPPPVNYEKLLENE